MMRMASLLCLTALVGLSAGCRTICDSGETQACTCSDGAAGSQVCSSGGTGWDACVCGGGDEASYIAFFDRQEEMQAQWCRCFWAEEFGTEAECEDDWGTQMADVLRCYGELWPVYGESVGWYYECLANEYGQAVECRSGAGCDQEALDRCNERIVSCPEPDPAVGDAFQGGLDVCLDQI